MDEIHELLKMARKSFNITMLSLGQGSEEIDGRFPKLCEETLPHLKYLNFSSFIIRPATLWDFSRLPLRKFNMCRMMCPTDLRIRMPGSLREIYINCQQSMIEVGCPESNAKILLNDCHKLYRW
jgi:hypothetical protein